MFRLKELREENGLKRSELARALHINAGTIANYERELRQAPYEYLLMFAEFFDVSIDYLLGREPQLEIKNPLSGVLVNSERELISLYRELNSVAKKRVIEYAELWKDRCDDNGRNSSIE